MSLLGFQSHFKLQRLMRFFVSGLDQSSRSWSRSLRGDVTLMENPSDEPYSARSLSWIWNGRNRLSSPSKIHLVQTDGSPWGSGVRLRSLGCVLALGAPIDLQWEEGLDQLLYRAAGVR